MTARPGWHLAVIDMQHVFADPDSPWAAPRFGEITGRVAELAAAAPAVTYTRFVAPARPAGAWREYYRIWPFALQPDGSPLYAVVDGIGFDPRKSVSAGTFSKWGPELAARAGGATLVLAGVATDCCVLSTALAAADAGVPVQVVADACAGASDTAHAGALELMALYAPLVTVVRSAALLG